MMIVYKNKNAAVVIKYNIIHKHLHIAKGFRLFGNSLRNIILIYCSWGIKHDNKINNITYSYSTMLNTFDDKFTYIEIKFTIIHLKNTGHVNLSNPIHYNIMLNNE